MAQVMKNGWVDSQIDELFENFDHLSPKIEAVVKYPYSKGPVALDEVSDVLDLGVFASGVDVEVDDLTAAAEEFDEIEKLKAAEVREIARIAELKMSLAVALAEACEMESAGGCEMPDKAEFLTEMQAAREKVQTAFGKLHAALVELRAAYEEERAVWSVMLDRANLSAVQTFARDNKKKALAKFVRDKMVRSASLDFSVDFPGAGPSIARVKVHDKHTELQAVIVDPELRDMARTEARATACLDEFVEARASSAAEASVTNDSTSAHGRTYLMQDQMVPVEAYRMRHTSELVLPSEDLARPASLDFPGAGPSIARVKVHDKHTDLQLQAVLVDPEVRDMARTVVRATACMDEFVEARASSAAEASLTNDSISARGRTYLKYLAYGVVVVALVFAYAFKNLHLEDSKVEASFSLNSLQLPSFSVKYCGRFVAKQSPI